MSTALAEPDTMVLPAYEMTPPAEVTNAAEEVIELAAETGLILDEWQRYVLRLSMGERADGRWAARTVGVVVPRQNGKGAILEARVLAGLFLFGEARIVWSAHLFKTVQDGYDRLRELIKSCPWMEEMVVRDPRNSVETCIELSNGCKVTFVARQGGSGRGLSGDLVILDEAYDLHEDAVNSLTPTMRAKPNPQLWYTSSAPHPTLNSEPLRRICRRGRRKDGTRPGRLAYAEWCVTGVDVDEVDERDESLWPISNPGVACGRIDPEGLREDLETMGREGFILETLGIWVDPQDFGGADSVMPSWSSRGDEKATPLYPLTLSVEVSWDRSHGVIGYSGDDGAAIGLSDIRPGARWIPSRIVEIAAEHEVGCVAIDPRSPAAPLIQRIRDELEINDLDIEVYEVDTKMLMRGCGDLFDAVEESGEVVHAEQSELDEAVGQAERRNYGESWLWARSAPHAERLVAVTVARVAAIRPVEVDEPGPVFAY